MMTTLGVSKTNVRMIAAVVVACLLAAPCLALESVGFNIKGDSRVTTMGSEEVAGVPDYEQAYWTTGSGRQGSVTDIVNSLGIATTIDLTYYAEADYYNTPMYDTGDDFPGNWRLMEGYLDNRTVDGVDMPNIITASEIPYGQYSVIVYCDAGNKGNDRTGKFTMTDPTGTTMLADPIFNRDAPNSDWVNVGYVRGTAATLAEAQTSSGGTYIMFEGLTAPAFKLEGVGVNNANPRAPINGIQIVNTFTKKATSPVPADKATLVPVEQVLSWSAPNDPNVAIVHGYRVFIDPNETKVLEGTAASSYVTEASMDPTPDLEYLTEYFWRVDADDELNDANSTRDFFVGDVWSFTTQPANLAPTIDVYMNVITAAELQPALLTAVVSDDDASVLVSAEFSCADPNVTLQNPGGTLEAPTVEAVSNSDANPHIFTVTLTVEDSGGKTATADAEVHVYATQCEAAQNAPSWTGHLAYDRGSLADGVIIHDCQVNLEDLAGLALRWLEDKRMTVQENL